MQVHERKIERMLIIHLGRKRIVEPSEVDELKTSLRKAVTEEPPAIGLNLRGLEYVSDKFVSTLMGELKMFARQGGSMFLFNVETGVRDTLDDTIIGHVVEIHSNEQSALQRSEDLRKQRSLSSSLLTALVRIGKQPPEIKTPQQGTPPAESVSEEQSESRLEQQENTRRKHGGRRPYGTTDAEAEILRTMIRMRENNVSFQKIADELNRAGHRNQGGKIWSKGNVYTILKNSISKS